MLHDCSCLHSGILLYRSPGFQLRSRKQQTDLSQDDAQAWCLPAWIHCSADARLALMQHGTDLIHLGAGRHCPHWQIRNGSGAHGLAQRRLQYRLQDDTEACVQWVRSLIAWKIQGQQDVLRSWWRRHRDWPWRGIMTRLRTATTRLQGARSIDALRSLEGEAAAAYFLAWRDILLEPSFRRRPQLRACPANLFCDHIYHHLTKLVQAHCLSAGYDLQLGILHPPQGQRPSLALDLIEPLRPRIADRLILQILHANLHETWCYPQADDSWTFTAEGRRKIRNRWTTWYYGGSRRTGQAPLLARMLQHWHTWLQTAQAPPTTW